MFTIEHEENDQISFLETCSKRYINKYSSTVYHKKTFTSIYLIGRVLQLEDTKLVL